MKWMLETTVWDTEFQPNHIYLMDGDKAVAYIRLPHNEPKVFKQALPLDKRGRTFKEVEGPLPSKKAEVPEVRKVLGSKGEEYEVNPKEGTCTCPGYRFRGSCKHVAEIQQQQYGVDIR